MRGAIAQQWHSATEDGKLAMLQNIVQVDFPLDVELLNEEVEVLDRLARQVGLAAIRVMVVDAAGMRDFAAAVVSPRFSPKYRARMMTEVENVE